MNIQIEVPHLLCNVLGCDELTSIGLEITVHVLLMLSIPIGKQRLFQIGQQSLVCRGRIYSSSKLISEANTNHNDHGLVLSTSNLIFFSYYIRAIYLKNTRTRIHKQCTWKLPYCLIFNPHKQ